MNRIIILSLFMLAQLTNWSQFESKVSYEAPRKYTIGDIKVEAGYNIDENYVISTSGLSQNMVVNIPGPEISNAIKKLWAVKAFEDVEIATEQIKGNQIYLVIKLKTLPRSNGDIRAVKGVSKSEYDKLKELVDLTTRPYITPELQNKVKRVAAGIAKDKGYFKAKATCTLKLDTLSGKGGYTILYSVDKGARYKINQISFEGNTAMTDNKLKRQMKKTKEKHWWKLFWRSKFNRTNYKEDKQAIVNKYIDMSYRDAEVIWDTVYDFDDETINIDIKIDEGNKYYIRSFEWVGNVIYSDGVLDTVFGIRPGDPYNQADLDTRLYMNPAGSDVSSLYMDKGYLFFQITPIEKRVENDSVDLEFRIYEGKQARIKNVFVSGNTKTSDHVIIRDLYTRPGDLFSRENVINSQRLLAGNGYFNPETLGVNPIPNPADGTVDIEYTVEESPSDQIELSGGFGAGRVVGTLGLTFNNFSAKRLFKKGSWTPLPGGDGQRLSIRAQSNGYWFQSYNFSFTEPWLGGKKPQSFSISAYRSVQAGGPVFLRAADGSFQRDAQGEKIRDLDRQFLKVTGASIALGKRLKWPDDKFTLLHNLSYQYYDINNYGNLFAFSDGYANNLSYEFNLTRNSKDQELYPRQGSVAKFVFKTTAPYSWFDGVDDYSEYTDQQLNKWLEYNKIKFTFENYNAISKDKKLVLFSKVGLGMLNRWNQALDVTPFERFFYGGSGLTGFRVDGREIIAMRGYEDNELSARLGSSLITKFTMEMRYPLSLNPSATVYLLGFAEAGNAWTSYKDFNPLQAKRTAGVGVRIFLPMFGLLGLDYGWAFDPLDPGQLGFGGSTHTNILNQGYSGRLNFSIGMNLGEL